MPMPSLQDFLKDLQTNPKTKETLDKARDGVQGSWDGPPMPLSNEYRVSIDKAEYKASGSGKMQFAITFEISAPEEFAGRKFQDYFSPDPSNEWGHQKFTQMIGAFGPDLSNIGNDWTALAERFNGTTAVVALRQWGEENDRYGVRYANGDRGQTLSKTVKPPKSQTAAKPLRPEISVAKQPDPQPQPQPAPEEVAGPPGGAPALPNNRPAGGPNLPPGLR